MLNFVSHHRPLVQIRVKNQEKYRQTQLMICTAPCVVVKIQKVMSVMGVVQLCFVFRLRHRRWDVHKNAPARTRGCMCTLQGNSLGNRSSFTSFGERLALYRFLHFNFWLDRPTLQVWNGEIASKHLCCTIRDKKYFISFRGESTKHVWNWDQTWEVRYVHVKMSADEE